MIDAIPGLKMQRLRSMFSPAQNGLVFVIGNRWGPARIRKFIGSGRAKIASGAPAGPHASWVGSDKQAVAQVDAGEIDTQAPPQPRAAKLSEISPQQQSEALNRLQSLLPKVGDEKPVQLLEFNHVGRRRILRAVAKADRRFSYDEAGDVIRRVEK